MGKIEIKQGDKFNKLTIIKEVDRKTRKYGRYFLCKCDCGVEKEIRLDSLRDGSIRSCGCVRKGLKPKPYLHPKKLIINTGDVFGRLTIIKEVEKRGNYRYFECKCECGTVRDFKIYRLTDGTTVSCGCYGRENSSILGKEKFWKHLEDHQFDKGNIPSNYVTGDFSDLEKKKHYYLTRTWGGIKQRCYNPNERAYKDYGERGIRMYKPWINDYVAFKTWILDNLGERPETYSLDRIDVNGNYEPGNLRWADKKTQSRNRRICLKNKNQTQLIFG